MRVSIITATYNSSAVIKDCIDSLNEQTYGDIEHVIIDGASKDNTLEVLKSHQKLRTIVVSEPDKGIYDALNKGIARATGDVIGILHSDDFLKCKETIAKLVARIQEGFDGVYSDLDYVYRSDKNKIFRHWQAGLFDSFQLQLGWMPPHPTLFLRREVFEKFGTYNLQYRISADYEFMLKILSSHQFKIGYVPETLVCMKVGGESNKSLKNLQKKFIEDLSIARANSPTPLLTITAKMVRKLPQLLRQSV